MQLTQPVENLPMVNRLYQQRLAKLNIHTTEDLLMHFPLRFDDVSVVKNITDLKQDDYATVQASIQQINTRTIWKLQKRLVLTNTTIHDQTGTIRCAWFNQPYIQKALEQAQKKNQKVWFAGKVQDKFGLHFASPTIELVRERQAPIHTARLVPVYPLTRGLSSRWLRYAINYCLKNTPAPEFLPQTLLQEHELPTLLNALQHIHFPETEQQHTTAKHRFNFEKLFIIGLANQLNRAIQQHNTTNSIPYNKKQINAFLSSLPFSLTDSQHTALEQILFDMEKTTPMNRLLEGDVGSGKTIVALSSALNVIKAGYKVAFMVPTEILATQHYKTIADFFTPHNIPVALLTHNKKQAYQDVDIIVGTHALIQKNIALKNIGLVIIDEQHRFGVSQRSFLLQQKTTPHLLSMTATPIPRTLALTIYGNLDISTLTTNPKGRKKIQTYLVKNLKNTNAYNTIVTELQNNHQVFIIFPLIEESEKLNLKAAEQEFETIQNMFSQYNAGLLHGRMKQKQKHETMRAFSNNDIQILVSTSVVEVGVDIPNATVMIIEEAHRFGLAQLHQFRGRVGRSALQSYCFLVSPRNTERLTAFIDAKNGFELAKKDLDIRGSGQLYGTQQSGVDDDISELLSDPQLVQTTQHTAQQYFPTLKKYKSLEKKVRTRQAIMHPE